MTTFIVRLYLTIRSLVACYREMTQRHELTFAQLVHCAQDEGDAQRARQFVPYENKFRSNNRLIKSPQERGSNRVSGIMAEPSASSFSTLPSQRANSLHPRDIGEFQPLQVESTVPTSNLPGKIEGSRESADSPLYLIPRQVPAPHVAFLESTKSSPVWIKKGNNRVPRPSKDYPICHSCYRRGHILPELDLKV